MGYTSGVHFLYISGRRPRTSPGVGTLSDGHGVGIANRYFTLNVSCKIDYTDKSIITYKHLS